MHPEVWKSDAYKLGVEWPEIVQWTREANSKRVLGFRARRCGTITCTALVLDINECISSLTTAWNKIFFVCKRAPLLYVERLCSDELLSIIRFLVILTFGRPRQLAVCRFNESWFIYKVASRIILMKIRFDWAFILKKLIFIHSICFVKYTGGIFYRPMLVFDGNWHRLTATTGCGEMKTLISEPRYDMLRCVPVVLKFDTFSLVSILVFCENL